METQRFWMSEHEVAQIGWLHLDQTFHSSLIPQLECSDWLHCLEETSQPLDGFLAQPCRVE